MFVCVCGGQSSGAERGYFELSAERPGTERSGADVSGALAGQHPPGAGSGISPLRSGGGVSCVQVQRSRAASSSAVKKRAAGESLPPSVKNLQNTSEPPKHRAQQLLPKHFYVSGDVLFCVEIGELACG